MRHLEYPVKRMYRRLTRYFSTPLSKETIPRPPPTELLERRTEDSGVAIAPGWVSNVAVEGVNGFEVLASNLQGSGGGFVVCHPSSGLEEGAFARLTFRVWRDVTSADCSFDAGCIELGDARDNPIQFELTDEFAYYQPTRRTK